MRGIRDVGRCWTMVTLLMLASAGCSESNKVVDNDLKAIGIACDRYWNRMMIGPSRPEDLQSYLENSPETYAAVKAGRYVVIWKVRRDEAARKAAKGGTPLGEQVFAYEATAAASGGKVLMMNGSIRNMTAAEFQAAAKAEAMK